MIRLEPFTKSDFDRLISWIDTKELLTTIAGDDFTFPLTSHQLLTYLEEEKSLPFNLVDIFESKIVGHAQVLIKEKGLCKIDKLLVGDMSIRGQGIGQAAINSLLRYSFENLNATVVELNVFDWNVAGIRCYEKCGFIKNESKSQVFRVESSTWTAINMTIDKSRWVE
jgi:RimJ/RimL family protein N-acetyltransferase